MTEEAPAPAPAPSPAESVAQLQTDKQWVADFNGDNGRPAQKAAAERKSALLRPPAPTAAPVPEHLREAMADPSTAPHAERYMPAASPEEYRFEWSATDSPETAQAMTKIAQEAAFAIGANPEFARATARHVEDALTRVAPGRSVGENAGSLDDAMAARYGDKAVPMIEAATAAVMAMPEAGRKWVQATLRGLDPNTAVWFTSRLAATRRVE